MADIKPGDEVAHISGKWGSDTQIVKRVNSVEFPEPVAFFVGGGFWRVSCLVKVVSQDAPPFDAPGLS